MSLSSFCLFIPSSHLDRKSPSFYQRNSCTHQKSMPVSKWPELIPQLTSILDVKTRYTASKWSTAPSNLFAASSSRNKERSSSFIAKPLLHCSEAKVCRASWIAMNDVIERWRQIEWSANHRNMQTLTLLHIIPLSFSFILFFSTFSFFWIPKVDWTSTVFGFHYVHIHDTKKLKSVTHWPNFFLFIFAIFAFMFVCCSFPNCYRPCFPFFAKIIFQ